jgi:hypothetical protein
MGSQTLVLKLKQAETWQYRIWARDRVLIGTSATPFACVPSRSVCGAAEMPTA